jgi:hypothetical protein
MQQHEPCPHFSLFLSFACVCDCCYWGTSLAWGCPAADGAVLIRPLFSCFCSHLGVCTTATKGEKKQKKKEGVGEVGGATEITKHTSGTKKKSSNTSTQRSSISHTHTHTHARTKQVYFPIYIGLIPSQHVAKRKSVCLRACVRENQGQRLPPPPFHPLRSPLLSLQSTLPTTTTTVTTTNKQTEKTRTILSCASATPILHSPSPARTPPLPLPLRLRAWCPAPPSRLPQGVRCSAPRHPHSHFLRGLHCCGW